MGSYPTRRCRAVTGHIGRVGLLFGLVLSLSLAAGCGGAGEASTDDWGLSTLDLPKTDAEIAAAYEAMPTEVAGFRRAGGSGGEHLVQYGGDGDNGLSLWNQDGSHRMVDDEELSPVGFLTFMVGTGELSIVDSDLDGEVVWIEVANTVGDASDEWIEYMLACGDAEGDYLFFFNAFTQGDLDAVIEAFVQTIER